MSPNFYVSCGHILLFCVGTPASCTLKLIGDPKLPFNVNVDLCQPCNKLSTPSGSTSLHLKGTFCYWLCPLQYIYVLLYLLVIQNRGVPTYCRTYTEYRHIFPSSSMVNEEEKRNEKVTNWGRSSDARKETKYLETNEWMSKRMACVFHPFCSKCRRIAMFSTGSPSLIANNNKWSGP